MAGAAYRRTDEAGCRRGGGSRLAAPASGGQRVRAARADRLCHQSPAVGGGRMSRWGETFAALSGGSDTLDTIRHSGDAALGAPRNATGSPLGPILSARLIQV